MNCFLCGESVAERPSVLVDFERRIVEVCTDCLEKADEPDMPKRSDLDREGDPALNGAWVA